MTLQTVNSAAIHAIGYDAERLTLEIIFSSGGIYRYAHVPPQIARRFYDAPSKGRFFRQYIQGVYPMHRLSRLRVRRSPRLDPASTEINPVSELPTPAMAMMTNGQRSAAH